MPNNYWCPPCGQMDGSHNQLHCNLQKEMNEYFDANADKAFEIKHLLTWFNSFKTLREYLKNDEDISKIDRKGFYHESRTNLETEWKDTFDELRRREKNKKLPFEERVEADIRQSFIDNEREVKEILEYTTSGLASITFDGMPNYSNQSSFSKTYPTFPEESEKIEKVSSSSRSSSTSSILSSQTKKRLETKIEALESKLETIQNLLEQLVLQKQCPNCNEELKAQTIQPNK